MGLADGLADTAGVLRSAAANAASLEESNRQLGAETSALDVYSHTFDGLSDRMQTLPGELARAAREGKTPQQLAGEYYAGLGRSTIEGLMRGENAHGFDATVSAFEGQVGGILSQGAQLIGLGDQPGPQGALQTVGAVFGLLTSIEQLISIPLAMIPFPAFPAVRITDMDIGLPHAHSHPPNLIPPAPPVPLPSTGPVIPIPFLSGAVRTLINGLPAARCGDMGLGIWCGGYFPMYEIFLGSSNVWIEGARAARLGVDITRHCIFTTPRPQDPPIGPMIGFTITGSHNVLIGGVPMPSLLGFAMGAALKGLFRGAARVAGRLGKGVRSFGRAARGMKQRALRGMKSGFVKCKLLRAEPVNVVLGEVTVEQRDFHLPGRTPLNWTRSYSSHSTRYGVCGVGWETPADMRLVRHADGSVVFYFGNETAVFATEPLDEPVLELVDGAVLQRDSGGLKVTTKSGLEYWFPLWDHDEDEVLVGEIRYRGGNWIRFVRVEGVLAEILTSTGYRLEVRSRNDRIVEIVMAPPDEPFLTPLVRYEYDRSDHLVAVYDSLNQPYRFFYDHQLLIQHTDRNGLSFYYQYDHTSPPRCVRAWGDDGLYDYKFEHLPASGMTVVTDSLGSQSQVFYDAEGLVTKEVDPLGGVTRFRYDSAGRTCEVERVESSETTSYVYDDRGNLTEVRRPDGSSVHVEYGEHGLPISITDALGHHWTQVWDNRGFLLKTVSPEGREWSYTHNDYGEVVEIRDPEGGRTTIQYDSFGRITSVSDALGGQSVFEHDVFGNPVVLIDPEGFRTTLSYDAKSRLTKIRYPSGRTTIREYDGADNLIAFIDEEGKRTRVSYTGLGEVKSVLNPNGTFVSYEYDTEENLLSITNEAGQVFRIDRDRLGRIVRETDFQGIVREFRYGEDGRLDSSIEQDGKIIRYKFDALGRLIEKTYPDGGFEKFHFDLSGNLVVAENKEFTVERSYDGDGLLKEERISDFKIRYGYDGRGKRIWREGPTGNRVTYHYDKNGRVDRILINDDVLAEIRRDRRGLPVEERLGDDVTRLNSYDDDAFLVAQVVSVKGREVLRKDFSFDRCGRLSARTCSRNGVDQFLYDPMDRIVEHLNPEGFRRRYQRGASGSLLGIRAGVDARDGFREYSFDARKYRFDRLGRLVRLDDGESVREFSWDDSGRLLRSSKAGEETEFRYDGLGRRMSKSSAGKGTEYCWDGDVLLGEKEDEVGWREYVFYPDTFQPFAAVDEEFGVLFFQTDQSSVPHEVFDEEGSIVWSARYNAFGGLEGQSSEKWRNPFRLAGQYYDEETSLCYNRHRYYDDRIGEFVSRDPLGVAAGHDLYAYGPNVWSWADPLGLECVKLGLGLKDPKRGLDYREWSHQNGFRTYAELSGRGSFSQQIEQAMKAADEIHVNLAGINPRRASGALNDFGEPVKGYTNYELHLIRTNPEFRRKTFWHDESGKVIEPSSGWSPWSEVTETF